jgi:putative DNA-invertase from lambdoid prophage Rac
VLIAAKLDRLFRSALDALQTLEAFKERGVKLHLLDIGGDVSGNGIAALFFTIVSAFAEFERERIRERVSAAKADQRRRKRFLGGRRPFGFKVTDDGELVLDDGEQAALRRMTAMRKKGMTLRGIQAALSKRGVVLSHEGIRKLLAVAA